jgi:hypothetical protein
MTLASPPRPLKEAIRLTQLLDARFGKDRFDREPVDLAWLAREYSRQIAPESPIHDVEERDIPGCMGALVYSDGLPRQWGIYYQKGQSPGRRAFTIGHELGHYLLHRELIETDSRFQGGITCDEQSVLQRDGLGIEKEADSFAAALLMPLHDFRNQLAPDARPDITKLSAMAKRYGVSLTAAILRWLEYTDTRAMMIVSNEGFALWARPSGAALRSGLFIRSKNVLYELPTRAIAAARTFSEEAKAGVLQLRDVWGFSDAPLEMCVRLERYDQEITLLHFEKSDPAYQQEEEEPEDAFDRFQNIGTGKAT